MEKDYIHTMSYSDGWKENTGKLDFNIRNDYLFRTLLQRDEQTLKGIVASILQIDVGEIKDIMVTNPIILGQTIEDKEVVLDVKVLFERAKEQGRGYGSGTEEIDLEMQGVLTSGWNDRTVIYLCRTFTEINHGTLYENVKPVWQVSFCNFTIFKDSPAFVSEFKLLNPRDVRQVYTEKFRITNINLTAIDLAEEKYKKSGLVRWCRLFKAESWEELKMIATEDSMMEQSISSIWQLAKEANVREQMLRREENEKYFKNLLEKRRNAEQLAEQEKKRAEQAEKRAEIAENEIAEKNAMIEELKKQIEEMKKKKGD